MSDEEAEAAREALITIRVRNMVAQITCFRVKKTTLMRQIFHTYAQRQGVEPISLRFLLDGERIEPTQTPLMLELQDYDEIFAMPEQGGC